MEEDDDDDDDDDDELLNYGFLSNDTNTNSLIAGSCHLHYGSGERVVRCCRLAGSHYVLDNYVKMFCQKYQSDCI